jgi:prolyl oligopeptidase
MMLSRTTGLVTLAAIAAMCLLRQPVAFADGRKFVYPQAKKSEVVDDYHGTKVADPYRWLEDPDSDDTRAWVEAENRLTFAYLDEIPERQKLKERLTKLWNYERYGVPFKEGGRYFWSKNDGLQNQSVLYTASSLTAEPRVLIDPNALSTDGTVALAGTEISPDGKLLAYGTAASGSDWQEWHVRDVETGKDLSDHIKWIKFSGASWTEDGRGFFYSRYDEPNEATKLEDANYFQKLYYHRVGTPQSEDVLVYERKDHKEWGFNGTATEDGKFLVVSIWQGTENKNRVYFRELSNSAPAAGQVSALLDDFDAAYDFVGNDGPVFYFNTTLDAPRGRVIAIDTRAPERAKWREIVPQSAETIEAVRLLNNQLVISYLKDAHGQVKVYGLDGKVVREIALPGIGTVSGFTGNPGDAETFYAYSSYTAPTTIYRLDLKTGSSTLFRQPKVDFDPTAFETKQVFYKSKDGTQVPMFLVHKKGLKLDGQNPTLLYGYGGFNVSLTPGFSVSNLVWLEMGGVYAVPNLRGGGEYGESWHTSGTKLRKQNVFDDFIAAAEWLIANKYTSPAKLAVSGGSNGGLLVGAILTQRPDLIGAALPAVGVMDMLRYHNFTIGWAWKSDYGSSENADEFKALYAYSPLHNIKTGVKYPATLITTADHDDRVVPAHSFKYAATLQKAASKDNPVLIRIETKSGHGASNVTKQIEVTADVYAFIMFNMGMTPRVGTN